MKKKFKNTLVGKLLIGAADGFTGGAISNVVYQDENKPAGLPDYTKLAASGIVVVLIILFATGKLTHEQLTELIKYFE